MCVIDLFFFSSRRRHTRCGRDWSSDVCSSDLKYIAMAPEDPTRYYGELLYKFSNPARVVAYIVAFGLLALHLLHGFGSAFQSMGQNNKYIDGLKKFGVFYSIVVPLGFILIAIALYVTGLK